MGIAIQEVTKDLAKSFKLPEQRKGGVLISEVNENGPSHTAGVRRGDVVVAFNDKEIQNVSQLRNMVARTLVGTTARVKVLREGKEQVIPVKIGERAVGLPDFEVEEILKYRVAGKSDAEIIALVNRLHAKRAELVVA